MIIVVSVSVGVTFAAWSKQVTGRQTNVMVIGDINIRLNDVYTPQNNMEGGIDHAVDKVVSVTNTGNKPCYVRVLVRREWQDNTDPDFIIPLYNTTYWIKATGYSDPDGYYQDCYYYKGSGTGILAADSTTEPLFSKFYLKEGETSYKGKKGSIIVKAQAVQSDNIALTDLTVWPNDLNFQEAS